MQVAINIIIYILYIYFTLVVYIATCTVYTSQRAHVEPDPYTYCFIQWNRVSCRAGDCSSFVGQFPMVVQAMLYIT